MCFSCYGAESFDEFIVSLGFVIEEKIFFFFIQVGGIVIVRLCDCALYIVIVSLGTLMLNDEILQKM